MNLRPYPVPAPRPGFVRYELYLGASLLVVILAVVVPQAVKHGFKGALFALLGLAGVVAGAVLVLLALNWLVEALQGPKAGWAGMLARLVGFALRFLLFGLITALVAEALILWHGLGVHLEDAVALGAGALGGAGGCLLHHRLGAGRFWLVFGRLCLALVASLFGGLLGILIPGNWGVDLGVLAPLLVFGVLVAAGRIVPPRGISVSSPPNVP